MNPQTEKLICLTCNAPISHVSGYDHSFSAPYGDTGATYNYVEIGFVCENGHDNGEAVLCENELAKRYYTRFGFPEYEFFPLRIDLVADVSLVEKLRLDPVTGYHNRKKGLCTCGKPFHERDLEHGVCHKCFREISDATIKQLAHDPHGYYGVSKSDFI